MDVTNRAKFFDLLYLICDLYLWPVGLVRRIMAAAEEGVDAISDDVLVMVKSDGASGIFPRLFSESFGLFGA